MFKQITAGILMAVILLQILNRTVIYIDYYANTASFAKNCVNKAVPRMHCNGKCQMMKKLQQEEKKDHQNPERRVEQDEVISSNSFFEPVRQFPFQSAREYAWYTATCTTGIPGSCFHPPSMI